MAVSDYMVKLYSEVAAISNIGTFDLDLDLTSDNPELTIVDPDAAWIASRDKDSDPASDVYYWKQLRIKAIALAQFAYNTTPDAPAVVPDPRSRPAQPDDEC